MELGGQVCPSVGHVELLPLIVGLGSLAASLPALLVMCQAENSSQAELKGDTRAHPPSCSQAGSHLHHSSPVFALTCSKYLTTPSSDLKCKAQE